MSIKTHISAAFVFLLFVAYAVEALATFATEGLSCKLSGISGHGELARCEGLFREGGDAISIGFVGTSPNHVTAVDLTRGQDKKPFQVLQTDIHPTIDLETVGILFIDLNFDGHRDVALMAELPEGANVPYNYYLYDPETKQFVREPLLDVISSPEIFGEEKEIRAFWRLDASVSGQDIWQWRSGKPVITGRIEETRAREGQCTARHYRLLSEKMKLVRQIRCIW